MERGNSNFVALLLLLLLCEFVIVVVWYILKPDHNENYWVPLIVLSYEVIIIII